MVSKVGFKHTLLFEDQNLSLVQVIHYFLQWVELALLNRGSTTNEILPHLKSMFATFGIPEEVMSNGGLQFSSFAFQNFAEHYGFCHTLSSPRYAQSSGKAERAVQTVKNFLKNRMIHISPLLAYRTSPLSWLQSC